VSQYVQGAWNVTLDVDAAALNDNSWLERHRWDGVICRHTTEQFAQSCLARGIPLVDLEDRPTLAGVPSVRPDNHAVGHMGAEHLLERGFRSFGFCGLAESWSRERFDGFREALRLVGLGSELFESEYHGFDPNWDDREHAKLVGWLRDLPRPLAVMACNDLRALQVSRACRDLGVLVPHEVAILGVNNDFLRSAFGSPPISSVATDLNLAGFRAAEMLDRLMRAGQATSDEQIRIDPLKVVVRGSTDVLAVEDKIVRSALHFIRAFACKGITAQDVSQHVGVSRYALERKFNQFVSRSPHAEIRAVQIARI
jgi:LacI family transcriptional regulator